MTTQRGGPGRGQGRKPVKQGEETVTISLRVTVAQREKLARLGGAEWVRGKIDRARVRTPEGLLHLGYFVTQEERDAAIFAYRLGIFPNGSKSA